LGSPNKRMDVQLIVDDFSISIVYPLLKINIIIYIIKIFVPAILFIFDFFKHSIVYPNNHHYSIQFYKMSSNLVSILSLECLPTLQIHNKAISL